MLSPHQTFSDPDQPHGRYEEDQDDSQKGQITHTVPPEPGRLHPSNVGVKTVSRNWMERSRESQETNSKAVASRGCGRAWLCIPSSTAHHRLM